MVELRETDDMAKIFKRGNTYYGRVTYRGREYRRSLETTVARVAQQRMVQFVSDVKDGKWGQAARRKFEEAVEKFIATHMPRLKLSSAKRYTVSLLNLHDHFTRKYLDEITSASMIAFETARRADGVTDSTIRRDLACLSAVFSCAQEHEWVKENPVTAYLKKAKRRGLTEGDPRNRFLSPDEEARLFGLIAEKRAKAKGNRDIHGWRMQEAAFAFTIDTGLRDEEVFGLEWKNLDLEARQVTVPARRAKSGHMRQVPLLARSVALLAALPRSKHSQIVFWHRRGQRYSQMYTPLRRLCEELDIEPCSFHDLRRTCGVRLLREHRMNMGEVSQWLGHSSILVTERVYAFLSIDELHRAVQATEARLAFRPNVGSVV